MNDRFANLKKIPKEPSRRMLALANVKLTTPIAAPASASVNDVLEELDKANAYVDMIRLLAVALPPRERVWWGCLAAEDVIGPKPDQVPRPLEMARNWVFKPSETSREQARLSVETADVDDDTVLCAIAVALCDGKIGPGELAEFDGPPGGAASAIFGMNMISLNSADPDKIDNHFSLLIDRALDIARGGNGRFENADVSEERETP